jgi:DNA-binding CsgD family transcriptional regulator
MTHKILAVLLFLCLRAPVSAADSPLLLNFPSSQYQAANQNWSISQDQQGILYFGNHNGLLEYDGSNWELHPLPNGQVARSVAVDQKGRIYCGSYGEFGYWQRDLLGKLTYTSLSKQIAKNTIGKEEFWHILVSNQGVYFQSFGLMFHFNGKTVKRVPSYFPMMFLKEINGRLLLPSIQGPIYEIDKHNKISVLKGSDFFEGYTITAILPDPKGMLVGTSNQGMFRQKGDQFVPWEHPANADLKRFQLNKAIRLKDGRLALGTILSGVLITKGSKTLYHLSKNNGLQNNTTLSLFEDKDQNLWMGLDNGIDLVALHDPMLYYSDREGVIGAVYAAAVHAKRLFIGTNQGVFFRSWPLKKDEAFQLLPGSQGQVWQLAVFDNQLICGHNEGTFLIEGSQFQQISKITGGWYFKKFPQNPDYLLEGTYTGFVVFKRSPDGKWKFSHSIEGFKEPIQKFVFESKNRLWAVNPYENIYCFELDTSLQKVVSIDTINAADGLLSNFNLDVFIKNKQVRIWSSGKQFAYHPDKKRCLPLKLEGEIHPKFLVTSYGDELEIKPQQIRFHRLNQLKPLVKISLANRFEPIIALQKDTYLLCLENGYALLNDLKTLKKDREPKLMVKWIECLNFKNRDKIHQKNAILYFPPGCNHLRFVFALTSFTRSKQFRYRLNGIQNQWSAWSRIAEHEFSNLAPGAYNLELQSDEEDKIVACSFYIAPHWYQSFWMNIVYALVFFGIFGLLNTIHQKRLETQKRKLLLEKERELHQQRIQTRNIQLQHDVLNKSKELASSTFHLIRKNEALLQIKEELIRFKAENADRPAAKHYQKMLRLVDEHLGNEQDWQVFEDNFNQVHDEFFKKLKSMFPTITPGDLRLAAYLRMNLSSKEIAPLLHLSVRGIENKRYRLRRKLELDGDDNLVEFLMGL